MRFSALILLAFTLVLACQPAPVSQSAQTQSYVGQPVIGSGPTVYRVMEDDSLRPIRDLPTFFGLGYQWEDVVSVADDFISARSIGPMLTQWVSSPSDNRLYFLAQGQRYPIPDPATLQFTEGNPFDVTLLPDSALAQFPLAADGLPSVPTWQPSTTSAAWWHDTLWTGDDGGTLTAWGATPITTQGAPIYAMLGTDEALYVGGQGVWRWDGVNLTALNSDLTGVVALAFDEAGMLWVADAGHYDMAQGVYVAWRGLVQLDPNTGAVISELSSDPLPYLTTLAYDPATNTLWGGTHHAGLVRVELGSQSLQALAGYDVLTMTRAADGVWFTTDFDVYHIVDETMERIPLPADLPEPHALRVVDGQVWVAGTNYAAHYDGAWTLYQATDHLNFLDTFVDIASDPAGGVWLVGENSRLHYAAGSWSVLDRLVGEMVAFDPLQPILSPVLAFPSPVDDYTTWLQTWPRPPHDNGRCMHYLKAPTTDPYEAWRNIERLQRMGVRWVLVNYYGHEQLTHLAPIFAKTDMMVIWRTFVRPYENYPDWAADVAFIRALGLPPYFQLYNEPSHPQEWDGHEIDQALYLDNLVEAYRAVYAAGGLVGLQHLEPAWLQATLERLKAEGVAFDRLFYVPHPYGLNHPPAFDEDRFGVLGYQAFADILEAELGFVPMMVAGEGGWLYGDGIDTRYPAIDDTLHREYHVALFEWFSSGTLSNGDPLPDYLFAFCPWLISDVSDPAAWFDSPSGDRTLTLEGIAEMPLIERRFAWQTD